GEITDNPVYYVLNLCRVVQYLNESTISSKREGGEWAISRLPMQFVELVDQCLAKYNGARKSLELNNHNQILVQLLNICYMKSRKRLLGSSVRLTTSRLLTYVRLSQC